MFLFISISIFFQSISLHYLGDKNVEKLLFSSTNQLQKIEQCKDDCVSIEVNKRKVKLILKSQGESVEKNYDFSKNKVSEEQFADLLRLKIILFRKEYKEKIENRFINLIKYELETKIKSELEIKMKADLEEKINLELEKKVKSIQSELENKISLNLNDKQKENLKIELNKIKLKLKEELKKELEEELQNKIEKNLKITLKTELDSKLSEAKKKLKKDIKLELKNEQLKKQYSDFMVAGNINLGIKRDKVAGGLLLEYKDVSNKNIISYSLSYLMRTEGELSKATTNFILLQIAMGRKFNIYKNIEMELTLGGFSSIVNLLDSSDNWFFAWETTGGLLGSLNTSILITPKWGFTFKTDLFIFLVNYRNTDNDGLYGNKKMSISFSIGGFVRF
jgi:hypothetical protein